MLEELQDAFGSIFNGNAFDVMKENPAGIIGLFAFPIIIMGFIIATNYTTLITGGTPLKLIAQSPACHNPSYYIIDGLNIGTLAVNMQCMTVSFNAAVFFAYYFELFIPLLIAAIIGINLLGL